MALEKVKDGFFLRTVENTVRFRVPTHGFGGKQAGKPLDRITNQALLVHHTGQLDPDLPLLADLYLLDVLAHPEELRKFVSSDAGSNRSAFIAHHIEVSR